MIWGMSMNNSVITKFGRANIGSNGYLRITSIKEGNRGKPLHRLIFEDFYKISLPDDVVIHHNDGNKLNNEIWNLIPMTKADHVLLHNPQKNVTKNGMLGKHHSEESCEKIRQSRIGKTHELSTKINRSKLDNTTGIFRVKKCFDKRYKKGFYWNYRYYEKGKRIEITSISLDTLKEKVLAKGLDWIIIDEQLANKTMQEM